MESYGNVEPWVAVGTLVKDVTESLEAAGLVWTSDDGPGITRKRKEDGFEYFDKKGQRITDEKTLARIRSLAIPPAYEHVWICPRANGHLQATGKDARGRKQYRYHPDFRSSREEAKFGRMLQFAKALPKIHEAVDRDLARPGMPREKALAAVVALLENSHIRIGNEEYAQTNKSYGLTTLRNRHAAVEGAQVRFKFLGKSKVRHEVALHDRRLARIVRKLQELPGQRLFQYLDDAGETHAVTSDDVNGYLKAVTKKDFTAKDFRTWAGTVLALEQLAGIDPVPETKREMTRVLTDCMKCVSTQLGNTPSVCRKSYVHPAVVHSFTQGELRQHLARVKDPEKAVAKLLRKVAAEAGK
ncbi:DNA topoisomerase IB [bacterium]|nr:MAG: DNA topoisomerase IB [bacterium]